MAFAVIHLLGLIAVGGLSVVALGLMPWGIRAVALFTLLGLVFVNLKSLTDVLSIEQARQSEKLVRDLLD